MALGVPNDARYQLRPIPTKNQYGPAGLAFIRF